MQAINGTTAAGSTTFSATNVASGTAGIVSWTSSGVSYSTSSSGRIDFAANSSMTISVSSGYVITKIETNTSTGSDTYYGSLTCTEGSKSVASSKNYTFSSINATSATLNNGSTAYRITSTGWIKVYYEESSGSNNPTISVDPEDATYGVGDAATALSVTAAPHTTGKTLSYKWYSNSSKSTEGAAQVGTSATYTPSTAAVGTTYYYCVVSEQDGGSATSDFATVQVKNKYTVTWNINGDETTTTQVVEGAKPTFPSTPVSCDATSTTFIGWATDKWDGKLANLTGKTVHTSNATMNAVTGAVKYYAVFAKKGSETSVSGGDMSSSPGITGWTYSANGFYSGNGVKFTSVGHNIKSPDISSSKYSTVTVKLMAGYNGSTGSELTIASLDEDENIIDSEDFTPDEAYTNQTETHSFELTGNKVISYVTVTMKSKNPSNLGMAYCEIFAIPYTDYMTTCAACTHLDDAPELNGAVVVTHNSATINWKTLTNASSYDVTVIRNSDSESIFSGNVNALTKALTELDPETQYDYSIMGVGDGSTYCTTGNGVLNGSFTTDAVPTAKLYLVQLKDETPIEEGTHTVGVEFDLPTSAATCGKTLVGWTTETYKNYTHATTAPTVLLKKYTFASTDDVTLYAVYANVEEDDETITPSAVADGDDPHAITINKSGYTLSANKNTGSTAPAWNSGASDVRIYAAGDITLASTSTMTRIVFNLSAQGKSRLAPITASVGSIAAQAEGDETVTWTGSATSVTFTVGAKATYSSDATKAGQLCFSNIDVTVQGEFSNYSTTCVDAPVATPSPAALNDVAVAGASGTITMTYEHVNASGVAVSLWNNAACTEAFEGSWLTASLDGDKNITYTIAENTSYNDARSAYIRLIAPETSGAASPAVVKIPVSQVKKPAVFASFAELAEADVAANTNVTVTLTNEVIKEIYIYNNNRRGLVFNVQKDNEDVKIYFNADVPAAWVAGGKVSGTLTDCPWKIYSGAWQLAPSTGFVWNVNLTYTAPPAIESIEIRGNATNKTYIDGQVFNPAGLSVIAIYDDNITEEDVTEFATWTYNPAKLSESDTEVTVTATYNEKSDDETVTGLTVNPIPNKTIAQFIAASGTRCYLEGTVGTIDNTKYGNFNLTDASGTIYVYGCLTPEGVSQKFDELGVSQGDRIKVIAEAYTNHATKGHEAVNVVFVSKVSAATIDIDDINMTEGDELLLSDIVATITPGAAQSATINYEVTEGTAVTISEGKIIASTEGEATITASIAAGEGYLAGSTTFTVTVSAAPAPFVGDYFVKVDDNSDLTAGEYLIVYKDGSLAFNGGLDPLDATSNYVAVTFENGKIQGKAEVLAATFTVKLAGGTIQSKSGYYIGRLGNSNGLNSSTEEAYTNTISIDENGDAVILASGGAYLRYNSASGQERFRYFKSDSYTGQKAIQLYKKENAEPVYETVRENLTANRYYTVCLPKKVTAIKGASFWTLNNKSQDGAVAYLEEETNNLPFEAGKPFIIQATAEKLEVVYEGAATEDAGTNGALHGTLVYMDAAALAVAGGSNVYMLFSNELRPVGENNHLDANRAYVLLSELNAVTEAPQSAPGKRVRAMPMQPQVATGMDALNASDAPVKVMIDGKFYILRGEKMYDATGKLVK